MNIFSVWRLAYASLLAVGLGVAQAHADPPARADASRVTCTVGNASSTVVQTTFDFSTMTGSLTVDGRRGPRRFKIKAVPYSATYILTFQGYATGDQKPAGEALTAGKSAVARLVAYGDVNHLFFDVDFHPGLDSPPDGLVCR